MTSSVGMIIDDYSQLNGNIIQPCSKPPVGITLVVGYTHWQTTQNSSPRCCWSAVWPGQPLCGSSDKYTQMAGKLSGWWLKNHLETYEFVNGKGVYPIYEMENKTCFKPPHNFPHNFRSWPARGQERGRLGSHPTHGQCGETVARLLAAHTAGFVSPVAAPEVAWIPCSKARHTPLQSNVLLHSSQRHSSV